MATKMVIVVMAFILTFCVSQFASLPVDDEEAEILAQLKEAPLENADLQELFQDSSELSPRFGVNDILKTLEEKCQCEELHCFCCGAPKIAGIAFHGCVNMTMYPEENAIGIGAGVGENSIYRIIPVGRTRRLCNSLPGILKKIKLCMSMNAYSDITSNSMTGCTFIEVDYSDTNVASIQFHCMEMKKGKVSFVIPPGVEGKSAIMAIQIKNPISSLVSWFKKKYYGDK